ncbi:MAG TPA: SpoIIE family protein phosphatase [Verrucomicrobiae bacterium]|nr:SpoIIE family protein phosphatase [Verrucomicrobiae bacterium]
MSSTVVEKTKLIEWAVAARPMAGQRVSGDLHVIETLEGGVLLAVIDGVGHGAEAGAAAQKAADILKRHAGESVIALVNRCHGALARTRGGVMTLASVDAVDNTVTWIGVGNVEARLFRAEADISHPCEHILLRSGLVGLQLPALQASMMPLAAGDLLVFVTDGIQTGFEGGVNMTGPVQQIAAGILSRHFKGTDDALVLVVRYTGLWS